MNNINIERKMKIIFVGILISMLVIILIIILLNIIQDNKTIQSNNENTNNKNTNIIQGGLVTDNPEEYKYNFVETEYNVLEYETSRKLFATIEYITNNYINYVGFNNNETLYDIVSNDCIGKYNINNNIPQASNRSHYKNIITDMIQSKINETQKIYIVKGKGRTIEENKYYMFNIMIRVDLANNTYCIYPNDYVLKNGYDKLGVGDKINISSTPISKNKNNLFPSITKTDLEMATSYFNNYKEILKYYKNDSYKLLNIEYSKVKFNSEQEFKNYLQECDEIISNMVLQKYTTYSCKDYTDYICTDQYNNYYIFRQQGGIMRYTVFLDTYTVELDAFKEEYEKSSDGTKVSINIDKFKQMLNTKDYNAIYNKLNVVFRNKNFNNISKLKEYLQKNVYDINSIELNNYNQNEDYYVCECTLYNQKNTNEKKNMTIVMKLIDSNNFEMSFSMN